MTFSKEFEQVTEIFSARGNGIFEKIKLFFPINAKSKNDILKQETGELYERIDERYVGRISEEEKLFLMKREHVVLYDPSNFLPYYLFKIQALEV